ncbi:MAG TPA: hypothetical protein VG126_05635 [Thermoleophilaceae bacterium]|nr:hypothetical protein [Thermoleophilaceae bacterium]
MSKRLVHLVAAALMGFAAAWGGGAESAAGTPDPVDHTQPRAPDGTPVCAEWVHDRYTVQKGGRAWATWHPPRDPRYGCAFGHEHGSNPRAFRHFRRTGMPAFGPIGAHAGSDEPHPGFKVFVANEDRKGLAWMMVLHQGSGSPRRGTVRFHSLETWLFRSRRPSRLLAHTRTMADFGEAVPNCPGARRSATMRLLPSPHCKNVYEEWATTLDVGGVFRARPAFGIDNAITQFDPQNPERIVFNKPFACGPHDPAGWDSYCKGDKRAVFHPRWVVRNRGRSRFRTDAYGRRANSGLLQVVARRPRVDHSEECCGAENRFDMTTPSDGGIYRAARGSGPGNFEFPGYCVIRSN